MSDVAKKIEDGAEGARVAPASSRGLRAAEATPSSLAADNTFEFVLATPAPVIRWYRDLDTYERFQAEEVLPVETAILMSESGRSIPILNSHQSYSVDNVIGVVIDMRIENSAVVCRGRLFGRDSVADIVEGVREGVLRNISVGYDILDAELVVDQTTGARTMRAKRWLILEASLIPVPADGNAQIRSATDLVVDWRRTNENKETEMTEAEIKAIVDAAVAEGVRAAIAASTPAPETAEAKAAREAAELAARNAPKAGERSAEETAQVTLLRSQATTYGVESAFDAMASTGASVAELRGVLLQGMPLPPRRPSTRFPRRRPQESPSISASPSAARTLRRPLQHLRTHSVSKPTRSISPASIKVSPSGPSKPGVDPKVLERALQAARQAAGDGVPIDVYVDPTNLVRVERDVLKSLDDITPTIDFGKVDRGALKRAGAAMTAALASGIKLDSFVEARTRPTEILYRPKFQAMVVELDDMNGEATGRSQGWKLILEERL